MSKKPKTRTKTSGADRATDAAGDEKAADNGAPLTLDPTALDGEALDRRLNDGPIEGARVALEAAAQLRPNDAWIRIALARVMIQDRQMSKAAEQLRAATLADPENLTAALRLGRLLTAMGDGNGALTTLEAAAQKWPKEADLWDELGAARRRFKKPQSLACFQRAVEIDPAHADALEHIGEALWDAPGQRGEAIEFFRRALAADSETLRRHVRLGSALSLSGQPDEARAVLSNAAQINPKDAQVWASLATLAQTIGQLDDAETHWRTVLAIDPLNPEALAAVAKRSGAKAEPDLVQRLLQQARNRQVGLRHRRMMHFALAEIEKSRARYDQAFGHLAAANKLRQDELVASGQGYVAADRERHSIEVVKAFGTPLFQEFAAFGHTSARPIFVVGMPRSGTTLCEQILASHSQVHGAGELEEIRSIVRAIPAELAAAGVQRPLAFPHCMSQMTGSLLAKSAERYLAHIDSLAPAGMRVVDKMPSNYLYVGLIHMMFPHATIVHCRRDPMDNCLSVFEQNFSHPTTWAWDLVNIGHYFRQYRRVMTHWERALPVKLHEFVYEDAVANIENAARRLVEACGLPWERGVLEFYKNERPVLTSSKLQVRQPIYRSSVAKWKVYERQLQPLAQAIMGKILPAPPGASKPVAGRPAA